MPIFAFFRVESSNLSDVNNKLNMEASTDMSLTVFLHAGRKHENRFRTLYYKSIKRTKNKPCSLFYEEINNLNEKTRQ